MQLVASRVQIKQTAVSYPGVGRFRRAETGILGRAIKGVPLGLPFLFAQCSRPTLWRGQSRICRRKEPPKRAGETPALRNGTLAEICCAVCSDLAFATLEETPR